ncbi:hypothetical protein BFP70_11635 [Thioclava sp. SK-1]|uniref:polysaccharide biosynthesis protein n=1 Tax=Thioclava sp. SK-1 TaxID=1889770 RepID=UPI000826F519|nr:nucleoside-diphosphate sugar epimerase/dehydratase [Thioclava sp. SK-1]OCX64655.1 hypothetical protein BFP70_11635 [Thioclava sp. SK-1]
MIRTNRKLPSLARRLIRLTPTHKIWILTSVQCLLVPVAFCCALALQQGASNWTAAFEKNWVYLPFLLLVDVSLNYMFGLNRLKLKDFEGDAILRSLVVSLGLGLCSYALSKLSSEGLRGNIHVVFALLHFITGLVTRRTLLAVLQQIYRSSNVVSRIAIYGAGRTGMTLERELRNRPGLMVHAFIDDNAALAGANVNGLQVYAGVHSKKLIDKYKINRVILAMPSVSVDKQTYLIDRLTKLGLEVQTLPSFAQLLGGDALMSKLIPAGPAALLQREALDDRLVTGCSAYRNANILITGGGGSIGLELCRQVLICRPKKLVLFELSELALYNAEAEMRVLAAQIGCEIVPILGTICDSLHIRDVLDRHQIDVVLHAAAYKHVPLVEANARVGLANNALGTAVLARAARDAQVKRFVLVSSDKAVRPGNLMGASKRLAELVVQDLAARSGRTVYSIVRFGNVMGSSGSVIPKFQEQIERGGPVTLTDKDVTRYFMTIPEASRLVLVAGSLGDGGEVYVLDMGKPIRIYDLAHRMIEAAGYTLRDEATPEGDIQIVTTGLRPGEKLHEELMVRTGAQTTAHPKIIRVREDHLSELETAAMLRDLREAVEEGDENAAISIVVKAVREYDPQSLPDTAPQLVAARAREQADLTGREGKPTTR